MTKATWTIRIKDRMQELSMTQETLANKLGITRGAVTHYLAGRRQPPLRQFQKIAAILKTDPAWLQYGTKINESETIHSNTNKEKKIQSNNPLPILSWEQAAEFVNASKMGRMEIKDFLSYFYTDKPHWYALRVKGDAMVSPTSHNNNFNEKNILIVDPDKTVSHGDYVIAVLPRAKEATFKQYVVDGGISYLKPLNPQYPMVEIDDSTHICGIVVGCLNSFI